MSVETLIHNALKSLVNGRVYPDVAPEKTLRPYITYQQVGGQAINFLGGELPDKRNSRFQINIWSDTRHEAATLSKLADNALRSMQTLQTTALGEPVGCYEAETKLRGTRQDFSFWVIA